MLLFLAFTALVAGVVSWKNWRDASAQSRRIDELSKQVHRLAEQLEAISRTSSAQLRTPSHSSPSSVGIEEPQTESEVAAGLRDQERRQPEAPVPDTSNGSLDITATNTGNTGNTGDTRAIRTEPTVRPNHEVGRAGQAGRPKRPEREPAPGLQETFLSLIRQNLFATAGIGLLMIGFVYLFSAISWQNLLPPSVRIGLGYGVGAALGILGVRLKDRNPLWSQIAQGGGGSIAYLATYVGSTAYGLMSPTVAFCIFALISCLVVIRSLYQDSKVLSGVGFLGAYAAPILAMRGDPALLFNLGYGLLVSGFALSMSLRRGWIELAVHAHLCAATLAGLTYAGNAAPIPAWQQQMLLNGYMTLFLAWAIAWSRHLFWAESLDSSRRTGRSRADERAFDEKEKDTEAASQTLGTVAACMSIAAVAYLGLQQWLLPEEWFAVPSIGMALVFVALSIGVFRGVLRETSWVLAAFSSIAGLHASGLSGSLVTMAMLAEGVVFALTADSTSKARQWLSRLLLLGATGLAALTSSATPTPTSTQSVLADGAWQIGVLLAALTALAMARKKDAKDEWFHALLACVAAVMFAAEVFPERSGMAMAVAAIAWIQVAAVLTLQGGDRSTKVFAAFAMLGWLILLATDPEVGTHPWRGWLHAAMLSIFVVLSAVGLRIRVKAPSSPASSSSSSFLLGNLSSARSTLTVAVALVPALIAFKLDASTVMVMSLASLGLSAVVVAEGRGRVGSMLDALWGWHDRAAVHGRLSGPAALLGVLGAVLTAELAGEAVSISAPAHLMSGLGGAASLLIWVIHGQHDQHGLSPERDIRSTLAGAAGIVVGYLWVISVDFGSTIRIDRDASWSAVRDSALLPFLVTGFGVWRLFLSSRSERRQAWQVSAVLCASATVCLLLKMGSALLSPIGAAASLLGTGVLLLLAGYIAPQPQDTTSETPPQ